MPLDLDPYRTRTFQHHSGDNGLRDDVEVLPSAIRPQIGCGCTTAPAVLLRDLVASRSQLALAIEVLVMGIAGLEERLDDAIDQRMLRSTLLNEQRPIGAVESADAPLIVFRFDEIGQYLVIGPSGRPVGSPLVVVRPIAAYINHGVHRRRAAKNLAAGQVETPTQKRRLWLRRIVPVKF